MRSAPAVRAPPICSNAPLGHSAPSLALPRPPGPFLPVPGSVPYFLEALGVCCRRATWHLSLSRRPCKPLYSCSTAVFEPFIAPSSSLRRIFLAAYLIVLHPRYRSCQCSVQPACPCVHSPFLPGSRRMQYQRRHAYCMRSKSLTAEGSVCTRINGLLAALVDLVFPKVNPSFRDTNYILVCGFASSLWILADAPLPARGRRRRLSTYWDPTSNT